MHGVLVLLGFSIGMIVWIDMARSILKRGRVAAGWAIRELAARRTPAPEADVVPIGSRRAPVARPEPRRRAA